MGRGGDLTDQERSFVLSKVMQNWNSELRQIKAGGRKKILQACIKGGVRVCEGTIRNVAREAKLQEEESERHFLKTGKFKGINLGSCREGKCGRKSKLTDEVKEAYREIVSRFAYSWTYLSEATLQEELRKKGLNFSAGTVHNHLLLLRKRNKKVYLKPMLTEHNKTLRMKYALAQIDRSHGRKRIRFKDNKRTIMVDESWFYLTSDAVTALLIEDMDVLIHPKVQHKSHIEKIMFLAVLGQPQKVIWKGEEIDFDGKIGLFPCTEEVATRRVSKAGPKGTRVQVNKNVDAEFYHNLFCLEGGVYDMIEAKTPWLAGDPYFIQQDGARPHTANGAIEDLVAGGTGEGFTPVIVTQPPNSPDLNINDLGFFASLKVDVKRICTHCTSREEMMANVVKAFEEYPRDKIDGIWACWFNNLRSVMSCDGGNDYRQAHNGGKKRKRETGSAIDLTVNLVDYDRCVRLCR